MLVCSFTRIQRDKQPLGDPCAAGIGLKSHIWSRISHSHAGLPDAFGYDVAGRWGE